MGTRVGMKEVRNENESENEIFHRTDVIGNMLLKVLPWLVLTLLVIQLLLHIDCLRPLLSAVYRMEGVPIEVRNVKDWNDEKNPSFLHHSS